MAALESQGLIKIIDLNTALLSLAASQDLIELEKLCSKALESAGKTVAIQAHQHKRATLRKSSESSVVISGLTPSQSKNFSIRFDLELPQLTSHKSQWFSSGLFSSSSSMQMELNNYEDIVSPEVLQAPICDLCIVQKSDPVPEGFYRLSKTLNNKKANLNYKSGGNELYLCIKKDLNRVHAAITALIVIYPDRNEILPPGFSVVKRGNQVCNINSGTSSERVFICFKKDHIANPLIDILVLFPNKSDEAPRNFNTIEFSPSGVPANLNSGTNAHKIYLCYKTAFSQFSCLENDRSLMPTYSLSANPNGIVMHSPVNSPSGGGTLSEWNSTPVDIDEATEPANFGNSLADADMMDVPVTAASAPLNRQILRVRTESSDLPQLQSPTASLEGPSPATSPKRDTPDPATHGPLGNNEEDFDDAISIVADDEFSASHNERRNVLITDARGVAIARSHRLCLLAVLTAVSARSGSIFSVAAEGINHLLMESDFFDGDVASIPTTGIATMLDLTVEAMCDRLDLCQESEMSLLLEFLYCVIKMSQGLMSQYIIHRIFHSLTQFLGYHASMSNWIALGHPTPCLSDGKPWTEFVMLEKFIAIVEGYLEDVDIPMRLPLTAVMAYSDATSSESVYICKSISLELIDEITESVEICHLSDIAQAIIAKQSLHVSSWTFWRQVNKLSRQLFADAGYRNAFCTLCAVCKLAWPPISSNGNGAVSAKELGTKLLALDLLLSFCENAGEKMLSSKVMGYQIRRLVVPCILNNLSAALNETRIFDKVMKLISSLWTVWRVHLRIEFANLCEQLCIRILQASVVRIRPVYQLVVLQELATWFSQPHLLLEMFVNFDMDGKFVSHWNIFSHLIRAVCAIAKRSDKVTGLGLPTTGSGVSTGGNWILDSVTVREVNLKALEEVAHIAKTLMDATGHAYFMVQDSNFRTRSLHAGAGWEEEELPDDRGSSVTFSDVDIMAGQNASSAAAKIVEESPESSSRNQGEFKSKAQRRMSKVQHSRAVHQEAEELLTKAIEIYEQKGSLKKALQFLVSKHFMADTPQEIASFLRVYKNSFDPSAIGDYLGEGGANHVEQEYWSSIRYRYTRAVSFVEMELEPALRLYLTGCGFRLPGEAQKIDRFVEVFQQTYWADNHGTQNCPLKHPDTVHLLTFAIIMLNTDLHRANAGPANKKRKKMTKEEFINNLRGADKGDNIDREYLSRIYDSIAAQPIELAVSSSEAGGGDGAKALTAATGGVGVQLAASAGAQTANLQQEAVQEFNPAGEKALRKEIARNVRDSEDLLRTLSLFSYSFQRTGVDTKLSLELVSFMYETVWFHFRDITEALLSDQSRYETSITIQALDILCSSLSSAIFLGLQVERRVFSAQLLKFHQNICAKSSEAKSDSHPLSNYAWYQKVITCTPEKVMDSIEEVLKLINLLKVAVENSSNMEVTKAVAARIEKKAKVLEKNTYFVREADLGKRNRSGRIDNYRFFLFSDYLIYCHQGMMSGEYIVHEQLPLVDMAVKDYLEDSTGVSLYIENPVKSFVVVTDSPQSKSSWLRDLQQTIGNCKRQKALRAATNRMSNRKLTAVGRMESQEKGPVLSSTPSKATIAETGSSDKSESAGATPDPSSPRHARSHTICFGEFSFKDKLTGENSGISFDDEMGTANSDAGSDDESISRKHSSASSAAVLKMLEADEEEDLPAPVPSRKSKKKSISFGDVEADVPEDIAVESPDIAGSEDSLPSDARTSESSESPAIRTQAASLEEKIALVSDGILVSVFQSAQEFFAVHFATFPTELQVRMEALQRQIQRGSRKDSDVVGLDDVEVFGGDASITQSRSCSLDESAIEDAWTQLGSLSAEDSKRQFVLSLLREYSSTDSDSVSELRASISNMLS